MCDTMAALGSATATGHALLAKNSDRERNEAQFLEMGTGELDTDLGLRGHGHVDGVGEIISRQPSENWEWVRVSIPEQLMKYVVLKGSITIDGVSLTVNEVGNDWIGLSLIPETLALTTLGSKKPGDKVNVEADVMAKHIERLLEARNI